MTRVAHSLPFQPKKDSTIVYSGYGYGYPVVVGQQYPSAYQSTYSSDDLQLAEEVGRLKAEVEHLRDERQLINAEIAPQSQQTKLARIEVAKRIGFQQ